MRIHILLPGRLTESVSSRLAMHPVEETEVLLHPIENLTEFPKLADGEGLLILQPENIEASGQFAAAAQVARISYGEAALLETPFSSQYGFMAAVAGLRQDLQILQPLINSLSPAPTAWWHVGHAGAAAFLFLLLENVASAMQTPLDPAHHLGRLAQLYAKQDQARILAESYLAQTGAEHFVSIFPERQRALASFLNSEESPARQIAHIISLTGKADITAYTTKHDSA